MPLPNSENTCLGCKQYHREKHEETCDGMTYIAFHHRCFREAQPCTRWIATEAMPAPSKCPDWRER